MKKTVTFRNTDLTIYLEGGKVIVSGRMGGKTFTAETGVMSIYENCDSEDKVLSNEARYNAYCLIWDMRDAYDATL